MPRAYDGQSLINSVRQKVFSVANAANWPSSDILRTLNEEMETWLVPWMAKARLDYAIPTNLDIPIVQGQIAYRLPPDCSVSAVRTARVLRSGIAYPLYRLEFEPATRQQGTLRPSYYFQGNYLVLAPNSMNPPPAFNFGDTIRLYYLRRPSLLQQITDDFGNTNAIPITGTTTATGGSTSTRYTFSSSVTWPVAGSNGFPGFPLVGGQLDFVAYTPSFEVFHERAVITYLGTGYVEVLGVPQNSYTPQAGDFICPQGNAPVCTWLPAEMTTLLTSWVAYVLLQQAGTQEQIANAKDKFAAQLEQCEQFRRRRDGGDARQLGAWGDSGGIGDLNWYEMW